jgi:hypothetical protein
MVLILERSEEDYLNIINTGKKDPGVEHARLKSARDLSRMLFLLMLPPTDIYPNVIVGSLKVVTKQSIHPGCLSVPKRSVLFTISEANI